MGEFVRSISSILLRPLASALSFFITPRFSFQCRHSGESRNPVCKLSFKNVFETWIPASAGMTNSTFKCDATSPSPVECVTFLGRGPRALLTLALVASACLAVVQPSQAGGEPGEFMQWGAGARSLAMGRAFLAVSDDASATYWNPAAMTQIKRKEVMALQATLFQQTNYSFLSYVSPSARSGVWGFNLTKLTSGGFEKVKVTVDPSSSPSNRCCLNVQKMGDFTGAQSAYTFA